MSAPADFPGFAAEYRRALLEDTLPFWLPRSLDREHGGFLTARDRDGTLLDTDKSVWQQGRFAWILGELWHRIEPRDEWAQACRSGIEFLEQHGFDPADGRMWFHVERDGQPLRKRRYAFSEAFAAIAFGSYHRITQDPRHVELAQSCLRRFLEHPRPGEVEPKFTTRRPLKSLGKPMIAIATAQELRASIGLVGADELIADLIGEIERDFVHPEFEAVLEAVTPTGEFSDHADGRTLNPGHAIEGAWFILREAHVSGRPEWTELGVRMLEWSLSRGWDDEHGGLLYFVDVHGGPVTEYWHDMKFWWPHNEAVLATLWAYRLTGDARWAAWHERVHTWAHAAFADREHGEWFGYLHRDGSVSSSAKGNLWKGPFHLPRMQLLAAELCAEL